MAGIYDIRSWADIVTAHRISGPDIVDGIAAGWADVERIGGILLLAQMSSRERKMARSLVPENEFIEVYIDTPLSVCEERDVKGLYAKIRR